MRYYWLQKSTGISVANIRIWWASDSFHHNVPVIFFTGYPPWPISCRRTDSDALGPFYYPFVPFPQRNKICTEDMINNNQIDQIDVSGYVFLKNSVDCASMTPQANAKVNSLMNCFLYNWLPVESHLSSYFCLLPQNFGKVVETLRMVFSHWLLLTAVSVWTRPL